MKLSVIIPSYRCSKNMIRRCIESVEAVIPQASLCEVIVVDSSESPDFSNEDFPSAKVRFIFLGKRTYAGEARNVGASQASGDFFFFLDADCVPDQQWMEALRSSIKNLTSNQAVTGRVDWERFENNWTCALHLLEFHEFMSRRAFRPRFLASGNMLITRETFEKIGGFKEDWAACEDIGFLNAAHSKGIERLELFFDPELSVTHHASLKSREQILEKIDFMGFHRGLRDRDLSPELQVSGKGIVKCGSFLMGLAFLAAISWRSLRLKSVSLRELLILFPKLFVLCIAWAKAFHRGLRT